MKMSQSTIKLPSVISGIVKTVVILAAAGGLACLLVPIAWVALKRL